jgi:hypothetical protein
MLKKTITYTDFNGEETTEVFFFHLSKAELVELEMSHDGGFVDAMKKVIEAEDNTTIVNEFKKIILKSYGQKTPDGKRFIKNEQLREEFESSEAFSTLFMELLTDAGAAAEFMNGIIPQDMAEQAKAAMQAPANGGATVSDPQVTPRRITRSEMIEMDGNELRQGLADGSLIIGEK